MIFYKPFKTTNLHVLLKDMPTTKKNDPNNIELKVTLFESIPTLDF